MTTTMKIKVFDNFLSDEEQDDVLNYCENIAQFRYGESDDGKTPPCGVTHDIPKDTFYLQIIRGKNKTTIPRRNSFMENVY